MISTLKILIEQDKVADVLKKKSSNKQAVKALQQSLFELGYGKEIRWREFGADGDYGGATIAAVKAFAEKNGIATNGEAVSTELAEALVQKHEMVEGLRELQAALDKGNLDSVMVRGSSDKSAITALQQLLHALGFGAQLQWERFGADGDYGGSTTAAVAALAEKEGLPSDGEKVGAELAQKLLEKYTPFLGDEWRKAESVPASASAVGSRRRSGQSEYEKLFPVSKRDSVAIQDHLSNTFKFEPLAHEIPGDEFKLEFLQATKKDGDASYYFPEGHRNNSRKNKVVLHFTAGQIYGDFGALTKKDREVSTAFVVGRDGAIYKLFDSVKAWSYHLGKGAMGGNTSMSSSSVGIEISNWGPLKEDGAGNLVSWDHGNWYCTLDQTEAYVKLSQPFRGAQYFASITPHQYESVIILLRYLTKTLGIQPNFLPKGKRDEMFASHSAAKAFQGICCHVNFRSSGKWDLPEEGFDWEQVIEGVTGSFSPALPQGPRTRSIFSVIKVVSEDEVAKQLEGLDYGDQDIEKYGEDGLEVDI
ncbi:MAG: peptidoglycan-binding protein [Lewinellaceae bacterium]|nr:peptidoglycan-binding protein [Phaeodactylibacter sp.]MCB0612914.1 peptidoglycan-binding protein [Phaeodactylibacter sp.]MCB9347374.1 peptidoglycan-binding protein [Lewinellaceae bacterium]